MQALPSAARAHPHFSHSFFISSAIGSDDGRQIPRNWNAQNGYLTAESFSWRATTARLIAQMRLSWIVSSNAICALLPISGFANATIDARVELPPSHSAPVVAKPYEIVTHGGIVSTQPPLAMVYLEGSFSKP